MQIHELPEYSGDPATNDVFPIDTGTHTFKLPFASLGEAIITTVATTISGVAQTVKDAIEALERKTTAITYADSVTDVNGPIRVAGNVISVVSGSNGAARCLVHSDNREGALAASASSGSLGIFDNVNNAWILQSQSDQNVVIPHVLYTRNADGTVNRPVITGGNGATDKIAFMSTSSATLWISAQWGGEAYSTRSIATSDKRLKKNIKPAEKSGLDVINRLDVKQFDWKDGHAHWDFGIIAQEAREIDKNIVVGEETKDVYIGIDTLYLCDILIKAVQELSAKVEALENER